MSTPSIQTPSRLLSQLPRSHSSTQSPAQAQPSSHPIADPTSSHNSAQGPSHHSPLNQDVSTRRPTKRPRPIRPANMAAERASSCSDSSSQSGMADNETEAERSQQSERSAPQDTTDTAPPKKKRTRTLTTPHQSAVLHALLAKSRFPTTAMREEVGRQIGLSARKVQIWFQNQRQKARRPQAESAPLSRPPQFGPFPLMNPAGPSSSSYPSPSAGPSSEVPLAGPSSSRSVMHASTGSLDSIPPLSGPGMPGWSTPRQRASGPSSPKEWEHPRRVPTSPQTPQRSSHHLLPPPRLSEGTSTRDSRGSTRGIAPRPTQLARLETSPQFSRTLPPITLDPLEPRTTEPFAATSSFPPHPPPSRTSANIVHRHSESSTRSPTVDRPGSPQSLNIPPPFALQPQPQWDPHAFSPFTRPEFASWSPTSYSARSSFSAGSGDRTPNVSPRSPHYYPSLADPHHAAPLDSLSHHMISPSRPGRRLSTSASSPRPSGSGHRHARSDDAPRRTS